MERLGFDPENHSYVLERDGLCYCENNCKVIMICLNQDVYINVICRTFPVIGPLAKNESIMPSLCMRCRVKIYYQCMRNICPTISENPRYYYSHCPECQLVINRMFEYWENRHPLLKGLSPNDYLKTELREPIITAKCKELRERLCVEIFMLRELLPKELCQEIIDKRFKIIGAEYRLSAEALRQIA